MITTGGVSQADPLRLSSAFGRLAYGGFIWCRNQTSIVSGFAG
jgi:hypothetical protein